MNAINRSNVSDLLIVSYLNVFLIVSKVSVVDLPNLTPKLNAKHSARVCST